MNDMIQQGYDDTKAIIQSSGPNGNAKQFYEESAALLKEETGVKRTAQNNTRDNLLNSYNKLKNSLKYWTELILYKKQMNRVLRDEWVNRTTNPFTAAAEAISFYWNDKQLITHKPTKLSN